MSVDFKNLQYLLTDVDDTLTTKGKLQPETFNAIWRLAQAGIKVIPITGGCAGWCDHLIRAWPVAAVIGEGGAFYFKSDEAGKVHRTFWGNYQQHRLDQHSILQVIAELQERIPFELAQDQAFRLVDVAIDYHQDARLSEAHVNEIQKELAKVEGLIVKKSSIHLNIAKGEFDKAQMAKRLLATEFGLSDEEQQHRVAVIGDAPNDESLFRWFPNSFGVANITPHLSNMSYRPAQITQHCSGQGFVELAEQWLVEKCKP